MYQHNRALPDTRYVTDARCAEELAAAEQLYKETCTATPRPMIIFNGELDRIRGGYFPALLYPGIARLEKEFLPQMEAAYYLHNFKGSRPGARSQRL